MPSSSLYINQIDLDEEFYVWASGQDVRKFNGSTWDYYDYTNSAVPSASPYYLDTRSISIDTEEKAWVGAAQSPVAGISETAVFWIDTNNVSVGKSWNFSDLGTFSGPQEISLIYSCPFGDDVLAFCTQLNGIGGTGASAYTRIYGATGGRLFYYLKEIDVWKETVENYTWPHIFDIKTKGENGNTYFYYLGTGEGLFIIPQGSLETISLTNGSKYIKQALVYNTHTSGIISDNVYCLDFDEDGNLWIGTDLGLSYFDGDQFWNYPLNGPVTAIKSRENGHVFYAKGDGELLSGTGLWHFNGSTHTQFNTSNSSLVGDDVLSINLIGRNQTQESLTLRENDFWILTYNYLSRFDYDLPHVYASSKYAGATGWNFTYYNATGDGSPLPKINKYTWTYPEWVIYDNEYLAFKHPGLDPRNLFLTTNLKSIADGKAGAQPYWNNWPVALYEQDLISESLQSPEWDNQISFLASGTGASGSISMVKITSSSSQTLNGKTKYYLGGYLEPEISYGDFQVQFGYYSDSTPAILTACNPTLDENSYYTGTTGTSSINKGKTGFLVSYSESGVVESILPFRGTSTEIHDVCPDESGDYVYVSGIFDNFIEVGEYVWGSYENINGPTGPTGSPVGATNRNVGPTSSYPWIFGAPSTGGTYSSFGNYNISPGSLYSVGSGYSDMEFTGYSPGSTGNMEDVSKVYFNYTNLSTSSVFTGLTQNIRTGDQLTLTVGSKTSYYRVNSLSNYGVDPSGSITISLTYQGGATGTAQYTASSVVQITRNSYGIYSYPLNKYGNPVSYNSTSPFIAKIGRDLGDTSSFTDINGPTGSAGYDASVRKSYRITSFRHFPPVGIYPGGTAYTSIDSSDYYLNFCLEHQASTPVTFSTLKNKWNRNDDLELVPEYMGDSSSNYFGSYVKMDFDTLSLVDVKNTSGADQGFSIGKIKSLTNESGVLITGNTKQNFSFFGLDLTHPSPSAYSSYPYYIFAGSTGMGITGSIVNIGGTSGFDDIKKIYPSKGVGSYYLTTVFTDRGQGLTGSYLDNTIVLGSTGENYLYTAEVTQQGVTKNIFNNRTYVYDPDMGILGFEDLNDERFFFAYEINTPGTTGYNIGLIKSNNSGKNLDFKNLKDFTGDFTITSDFESDLFISGINSSGLTGATGSTGSFIYFGATSGFSAFSKQYYPDLGINLGNIISRPGSGAWTWCDVHSTDNYIEIPILSTVVFNNYSSDIYGKNNNKWILSNSSTGEELLNVKLTPYFIYTFTDPGYYTIYNEVEDSQGNVYQISKPGFIYVIDHKVKRPDDKNPDFVDSNDYGYPGDLFTSRDEQAIKLSKDLAIEQEQIMKDSLGKFGSGIVIPDNPDSTFNY